MFDFMANEGHVLRKVSTQPISMIKMNYSANLVQTNNFKPLVRWGHKANVGWVSWQFVNSTTDPPLSTLLTLVIYAVGVSYTRCFEMARVPGRRIPVIVRLAITVLVFHNSSRKKQYKKKDRLTDWFAFWLNTGRYVCGWRG